MEKDDLALLPGDVRARARIDPNGEVSWPISEASHAISCLADAGFVILGLDVRWYDDQGHIHENAWSALSNADYDQGLASGKAALIELGRDQALQALARERIWEFGNWILVTWQEPKPR